MFALNIKFCCIRIIRHSPKLKALDIAKINKLYTLICYALLSTKLIFQRIVYCLCCIEDYEITSKIHAYKEILLLKCFFLPRISETLLEAITEKLTISNLLIRHDSKQKHSSFV